VAYDVPGIDSVAKTTFKYWAYPTYDWGTLWLLITNINLLYYGDYLQIKDVTKQVAIGP